MAEISRIKLKAIMFDDKKVRLIQVASESDAIIIMWIRLLVLAGRTNDDGLVYIQRNMPYTEEMLATLSGRNVSTVRPALTTLVNFNMISLGNDGLIIISNWERHQNIEGVDKVRLKNAGRNRKYRERKRQERLKLENDVSVTPRDGTDKDIEEDIDINREEKKGKYSDGRLHLAEKLQSNLTKDFPKEVNKVGTERWANTIRLMREKDKASMEAIEYVINWLPINES